MTIGLFTRRATLLLNAGILFLAVVVALIAAEVGARLLVNPGDYLVAAVVDDSILGRSIQPNTGGHDGWGFRNQAVPSRSRLIGVGDSQTYGWGISRNESWPAQLEVLLGEPVYNLSLGGYGPLEYLYLIQHKAPLLAPEVVVVGLYLGNDIIDAYKAASSRTYWEDWRLTDTISEVAAPATFIGAAKQDPLFGGIRSTLAKNSVLYGILKATAGHGIRFVEGTIAVKGMSPEDYMVWKDPATRRVKTIFTPRNRLQALDTVNARVQEGLAITKDALRAIAHEARQRRWELLVVLVPTKERAYCDYLTRLDQQLPRSFEALCAVESAVKASIADRLDADGIHHVDALPALEDMVADHRVIYQQNQGGHPLGHGQYAIAQTIRDALRVLEAANDTLISE